MLSNLVQCIKCLKWRQSAIKLKGSHPFWLKTANIVNWGGHSSPKNSHSLQRQNWTKTQFYLLGQVTFQLQ